MSDQITCLIASFTTPVQIGTNPQLLLWLLPLVVAIAAVYKATKLPTINVGSFTKEVVILSASIIIFIAVIAFALFAIAKLITE
jgi:hypothetical protein